MGKLGDTTTEIGVCGKIGQFTLIIINLFFIVLGIISLSIGIWALASGTTFAVLTGNQIIGGSALLIITGFAVVVVAAFGMFGAMCKNRVFLVIYSFVLLAIIILEIVAGILAFLYRKEVGDILQSVSETNLIASYNSSDPSSDQNRIVNFIQSTFSCCGIINATDWVRLNIDAITTNRGRPPMCVECIAGEGDCVSFDYPISVAGINSTASFNTTSAGCDGANTTALFSLIIGAGVVAIFFGILEIIGVLVGLLLCCCISRAKTQIVV